jgi:uncharacterized protein (UPF0335 family)
VTCDNTLRAITCARQDERMDRDEGDEVVATARLRAALIDHIEAVEQPPDEVSERARDAYERRGQT